MSFTITVGLPPIPNDPVELDRWLWQSYLSQSNTFELYSRPLGAQETVYYFWVQIASAIGLPLLASIWPDGLRLESAADLARILDELDQLEHYWTTHRLEDPNPRSAIRDQLDEVLRERLGYFREAVAVARQNQAILLIY